MSTVSHIYVFDVVELDEAAQTVQCEGVSIDLTNAEFKLLLFFVKNKQVVYGYNELYEEIFGLDGQSQENTIPTHISNLRTKLRGCSDKKLFKNIPNTGYRFVADVSLKEPIHSQITKSPAAEQLSSSSARKTFFGTITAAVIITILTLFYVGRIGQGGRTSAPHLTGVEFVSQPLPDRRTFLNITGEKIDVSSVTLRVTGPGCGEDAPCVVPNGVLSLYGAISEYQIEKAPVTLTAGEYRIWLENEAGISSNSLTLAIPEMIPD